MRFHLHQKGPLQGLAESQCPRPAASGVNTTKPSNTARTAKVSKPPRDGKGSKSARARQQPDDARPPRHRAHQTFPLSNVRGCPQTDAATIAPPPRQDPPATPPGARRNHVASRLKRLRMAPDYLLKFPRVNHRYLSSRGQILFDNRYEPRPQTKGPPLKRTLSAAQAGGIGTQHFEAGDTRKACPESQEDAFHSKPMINLPVPDHIQAMLVDDWENITKNNQLVPLPHPKPVTKILEDYLSFERPHREAASASMDILEEVVAGFREYFEKALSRILLYRFERHQYIELRKLWDNVESPEYKSVCDVYGAEHLARLIVSLPELLAQTNMDQQSVSRLREEIGKFTVWLGRHCETYFVSEYETPSQEYVDKARSF
ncbi:keratinolytic protein [Metarhizium album ARSEF 1941]|uniref:Chromatin modification-related protein EAF3 n=1 Tax=Metarhizium album (strain ARSEF 1941) TaxID=1081103 RepID=A0A0B2X966_METAS|nr:keratinolytic protein [Metarhizium album ARSEF 1941]KHO01846.1 keratinolytic protein [Metarhizium album ARSEF 1941]